MHQHLWSSHHGLGFLHNKADLWVPDLSLAGCDLLCVPTPASTFGSTVGKGGLALAALLAAKDLGKRIDPREGRWAPFCGCTSNRNISVFFAFPPPLSFSNLARFSALIKGNEQDFK